MFVTKIEPRLSVPVTEGTVVTIQSSDGQDVDFVIENLDVNNTLTYHWESSPDNAVWTDVAVAATVAPGQRAIGTLNVALATAYRLRASGNLDVAVRADSQVTFSSTVSFDADGRFQSKTIPLITVADTSDLHVTQVTTQGLANQSRRMSVENTGGTQLDGIKWQYSPDNANWTDVAASVALAAGQTNKQTLSGFPFYRLQVDTDGTTLAVKMDTELFTANKTLSVSIP